MSDLAILYLIPPVYLNSNAPIRHIPITIGDHLSHPHFFILLGALRLATARADRYEVPTPQSTAVLTNESGDTLLVETSLSKADKERGLMGRQSLPRGHGMYFPLRAPETPTLWMKDVQNPLDIVFLRRGVIKEVILNVPPCTKEFFCPTYRPSVPVDGVLELGAGEAERLNLRPGSLVHIRKQFQSSPEAK